jgi:glutamate--cysteine ligase
MSKLSINNTPMRAVADGVEWFRQGCAPEADLRMGLEAEHPAFLRADNKPVPYRDGVEEILNGMIRQGYDVSGIERGNIVALARGNQNISLERGGQVELDPGPCRDALQLARAYRAGLDEMIAVGDALGIGFIASGFHPTAEALPVMPKGRYGVLGAFWARHNDAHGPLMMSNTASLQMSFGYTDERDMVEKLRVAALADLFSGAICANSPFMDGRPSGFQSTRNHNNNQILGGSRYGCIPEVIFDADFGWEKLVAHYIGNYPMIGLANRDNVFVDARDARFTDRMAQGAATVGDLAAFVNTVYPGARGRGGPSPGNGTIEIRSGDLVPPELCMAMPAFFTGLLYDKEARAEAWDLMRHWSRAERAHLRAEIPRDGLQTKFLEADDDVQNVAKQLVIISTGGLKRRGLGEETLMEPVEAIAAGGWNWARINLDRYEKVWGGDISRLYAEMDCAANPSVLAERMAAPAPRRAAELGSRPR